MAAPGSILVLKFRVKTRHESWKYNIINCDEAQNDILIHKRINDLQNVQENYKKPQLKVSINGKTRS